MSTLFAKEREEFIRAATRNMHRVLVLMMGLTLILIFFIPELLLYVIRKPEYFAAQPYIILLTLSFFLYSLMDLGTSSVFVPANRPRLRAVIFGILTLLSGAGSLWALALGGNALVAAAAMLASSVIAYIVMVVIAKRSFSVNLVPLHLGILLVLLGASGVWLYTSPSLAMRAIVFVLFGAYILYEAHRNKLVPAFMNLGFSRQAQSKADAAFDDIKIICFAGAPFEQMGWTNRQHIMDRFSKKLTVPYDEPSVWIIRY